MSTRARTLAIWITLVALLFSAFYFVHDEGPSTHYDETVLAQHLATGQVASIDDGDDEYVVHLADGSVYGVFATAAALTVIDAWEFPVAPAPARGPWGWLFGALVVLTVVFIVVALVRRGRGGAVDNVFSMRRSQARVVADRPKQTFADVGGATEAKLRLQEVVGQLAATTEFDELGARMPRGILLEGPPGCGKTLLARALAGETGAHYFEVGATEFVELFVGVGSARVRDLFEEARKKAPAVVFIDELDAIGRRRGSGTTALINQEREQALNQLLVSMDGFAKRQRVIVVAATNRADVLDPALLRPGRFDLRIAVSIGTVEERREVLEVHTRGKTLAADVDLDEIARATDGASGADLELWVNEAALHALRRVKKERSQGPTTKAEITRADVDAALAARREKERRLSAFDLALVEAQTQLAQPTSPLEVRVVTTRGEEIEGALAWMDASSIKLIRDDRAVIINRAHIVTYTPSSSTPSVTSDEVASQAVTQLGVEVA